MNINSQVSSLPLATVVNSATDSLRRENSLKEVTPPPAAMSQSAAEKGLSNKYSSKSAPQKNEQIDFANLKKQATKANASINDQQAQQDNSPTNNKASDQSEQNLTKEDSTTSAKESNSSKQKKAEAQAIEQQLNSLKRRDQEVKAHEAAHASVGGSITGAPSFSYQRGPDGKSYAVDGEVSVDVSTVSGDPQATIAKMEKVHAAALAPLNPSAQDKSVAAQATKNIAEAQLELLQGNIADASGKESSAPKVNESKRLKSEQNSQTTNNKAKTSNDFDTAINKTLKAQEEIAPSRSNEVIQRALRIENFYSNINQAYSKEPSFQFQLTA